MKKINLKLFGVIFLLSSTLQLLAQDNLQQRYEAQQKLIEVEEEKIATYIEEHMNIALPNSLKNQFQKSIAEHEYAEKFTEIETQQMYIKVKEHYLRTQYFQQNTSAAASYAAIAASSCSNGDFEMGTFANYSGETAIGSTDGYRIGDCGILTADSAYQTDPIVFTPTNPNGAWVGHFNIMNVGNDPNVTTGVLPQVFAGNHSARINSDDNGPGVTYPNYSVSKLIKRVVLSQVDEIIFFNYALVLQDPGSSHDGRKPTFVARVLDANGNECDRICHAAYSTDPFLLDASGNGSIRYKPWNCESVQACGQPGDTVTLEFVQTDCGYGGHWGYAYLDNICDTCSIDTCNFQGSIDLNPTDTCMGDTMQVCGTYNLAAINCQSFSATEIRLYILQGGAVVAGPLVNTSPSGGTFCFTVTPGDLPAGTVSGDAFDFYAEIDFNVNGSTSTQNDYNTNSGLDNDYVYDAQCCPEFQLLTCCDLSDTTSSGTAKAANTTPTVDPRVSKSLYAYKKAVEAKYPSFSADGDGCCDYCKYPDVAFPVFIYDESGMLIDNTVYSISWSNDPGNNSAIGYVLPDEEVIVKVAGPGDCVWLDTFLIKCCDEPGLPGVCCDTIDFNISLDSLCNFDPCKYPYVQFPIQVSRDGMVIGTPQYSFSWSNGTSGSATSASLYQLPISVTVTDNSTGCTTVGTYDIECDPPPCEIKAPEDLKCALRHDGQFLSWASVPNAVSYELDIIYNDPKCCNSTQRPLGISIPLTDTTYLLSDLSACFSWRVRAVCKDGTRSDWSITLCSCGLRCFIQPPTTLKCDINKQGQLLSWSPVLSAVSYEIELYKNDPACCRNGLPGSITIPIPVAGTTYQIGNTTDCFSWKVRAVCSDGSVSAWSTSHCSCNSVISPQPVTPSPAKTGGSLGKLSKRYNLHYSAVPNPADDQVSISFHDDAQQLNNVNAQLVIMDISGKKVFETAISANEVKSVDISQFEAGVYVYRIIKDGQVLISDKLLVE
jgi:hypothetical protein